MICNTKKIESHRQPLFGWHRYSKILLLFNLSLFFICKVAVSAIDYASIEKWIKELSIPEDARKSLLIRLQTDSHSNNWMLAHQGFYYSLSVERLPNQTSGTNSLAKLKTAEKKSRQGLIYLSVGKTLEEKGFNNREAIAKALSVIDNKTSGSLLSGMQSKSEILENHAVALFWIPENTINAKIHDKFNLTEFLLAYCQAIYPVAAAFRKEGNYENALLLFREMHSLKCEEPLNYFFDAADSFLKIHQFGDAQRMVFFVLEHYDSHLKTDQLERAGDLLFELGEEKKAQELYQRAFEKVIGPP